MQTLEILGAKPIIEINSCEEPTLGQLAAIDIRKAEVLKNYGLDFCCGGRKTLKQACEEKNIDIERIRKDLQQASLEKTKATFDFDRWNLDFLSDYIYNEHHQYWYNEEPTITELATKVVSHHGSTYPELKTVGSLYTTLRHELNVHFMKEEKVLFPHIKELVRAKTTNSFPAQTNIEDITAPLKMMEAEHEAAGEILAELRQVTNNYTVPDGGCNSFRLLYHKLNSLEVDLHQHIHLENNILFPKAAVLHKQLLQVNNE